MQIKNNVKIHNRFDIEIVDKNTGEVKQSLVSYNIVLNQMYTRLCGGLSYFVNIHFGSGTGTLSPSRTTLFSHLGTKAAVDEEIIKAIPLSVWKRKIVLNPEENVGNTISEVGIAFGSTNTNLVTHSLLKDSEGNTISIVKTDIDVITIYATVFVTFDTSNPNLTYLSMPSSNQLVNYLIGGSTAPTGSFSLNDTFLAKVKLGSTTNVTWTSDTVTKQRKTNVPRFATTVGNGHVRFLEFVNIFSLELPYTPVFTGQIYSGVSLGAGDGVEKEFQIPSANIKENSIVVKKNGVVESTSNYVLSDFIGEHRSSKIQGLSIGANSIASIAISGDGKVVAIPISSSNNISICDFDGDNLISRFEFNTLAQTTNDIALSYDGMVVARSSSNGSTISGVSGYAKVFDVVGNTLIPRATILNTTTAVQHLELSNDGNRFIYAPNSNTLKSALWNGTSWSYQTFDEVINSADIVQMKMNKAGNVLAVAISISPFIVVFDLVGTVWTKRVNLSVLPSIAPTGIYIAEDGQILFIEFASGNEMYRWNGLTWSKAQKVVRDPQWYRKNTSVSDDRKYLVNTNGGVSPFNDIKYGLPFKIITFNSAPSIGDVITADYTVDGVHKTDQYVIDASFAIQFGEI